MHPWFIALPWIHYLNFKTKECYHTTRFEKATRYYVIRLEQDLLGDWTLCGFCRKKSQSMIEFKNFSLV